MKSLLIVVLLFALNAFTASGQSIQDSLSILHSPKKATILSMVLPGAGQAYNHKYWKIPVIYAGFAGLGYLAKINQDDYKIYKNAYRLRLDGDESTIDGYVGVYSDQDLATLKNYYRRNRDLSIIGMSVLYILNILDASVDAHLFYFNVSDDLSFQVQPGYSGGYMAGPNINLSINF